MLSQAKNLAELGQKIDLSQGPNTEKITLSIGFGTAMKTANQDDSNDTPQPLVECQVDFPLLWIKDYPGLS